MPIREQAFPVIYFLKILITTERRFLPEWDDLFPPPMFTFYTQKRPQT